jgi:hypothetical protein
VQEIECKYISVCVTKSKSRRLFVIYIRHKLPTNIVLPTMISCHAINLLLKTVTYTIYYNCYPRKEQKEKKFNKN